MILNVIKAEHLREYTILVTFNDKTEMMVDLRETIFSDKREIFKPLRDINYFKKFRIIFNTISWPNQADFAPEFLKTIGKKISSKVEIDTGLKIAPERR